jgi:5-hydroxyisourate hydrolase
MGKLTTHVLDTAKGIPAQGMKIDITRDGTLLRTVETNSDGRLDAPMLQGDAFSSGSYELLFHAGDYLRRGGTLVQEQLFLDLIPIRFSVADASQHFHVPLLLSPFSYSTYRGS